MITGDWQRNKKHRSDGLKTIGPHFKLSAAMVELSLGHKQLDSLADIPKPPIKPESYSAEAKVQFSASIAATTNRPKGEAVQLHHSGLKASRELISICLSRINQYGVKIYSWLKTRTSFVAACSAAMLLILLAFSVVYTVRDHHRDSLKSLSPPPAAVQHDSTLVSSSASEQTHSDAHTVAPNQAKSRRRQDDYVAKDTYVYYGKEGKPNH